MNIFRISKAAKNFHNGVIQPVANSIRNAYKDSWLERVIDPSGVEMRFNAQEAEKNREWNAEQARIARETQIDLSNTAIERGIADAQRSGINPYAVYSSGGASTPTISAASGTAASASTGATSRAVLSALSTVANVANNANRNSTALAATALKILAR